MSREILFRGKSLVFDDWVEGDLLNYSPNPKICVTRNEEEDKDLYFVLKETVGQYTGLTDKNGKRIFDGDILKFKDDDGDYSLNEVYFDNNLLAFMTKETDRGSIDDMSGWEKWRENYEVIGNIHDNNELLEVSE